MLGERVMGDGGESVASEEFIAEEIIDHTVSNIKHKLYIVC